MPAKKPIKRKTTKSKKKTTRRKTVKKSTEEVYRLKGKKVVKKITQLVKEGNVRKITVRDNKGKTIFVMPVTVGVVGAVLAAPLVVIGAIAAMVTECEISVERTK